MKFGVGAVLLGPIVLFAFNFWRSGGSTEQFFWALLEGALMSLVDFLSYAFTNPVLAGLYLAAMWMMWRFAFGD